MSSSSTMKRRGVAAAKQHRPANAQQQQQQHARQQVSQAEAAQIIERFRVHRSADEMAKMEAQRDESNIWVEMEDDVHSGTRREKLPNGRVKVELDNGNVVEIEEEKIETMNAPKFDKVEDMSNLTYLNDPAVSYNLVSRYISDHMYTNSGISLIAINPYKDLNNYGKDIIESYEMTPESQQPPHIYAITLKAYHNMMFTQGMNQSILCTGESGAGKTENAKQALGALIYLSVKNSMKIEESMESQNRESILEKQILASNPILESFGNAKTIKNDNSSRFGKFIQINYDPTGIIKSCKIRTYLLEKPRVTFQNEGERNFHIFYIACEGIPVEMRKECLLEDIKNYKIMTNGPIAVRDINSKQWADSLFESLKWFNIDPMPIFKIISGILQIGNLEFEDNDTSVYVKNDTVLQKAASLLQVDAEMLKSSICEPTIKIGKEITKVSQSAKQCLESCRSLIRAIYENLFFYLVKIINTATRGTGLSPTHTISIVDNAGFEIFEKNSLEQLAINNTNEKVQQFFNHHMFIAEQEEYAKEKIEWDFTDFGLDLEPTITLINGSSDKKVMSIFGFINEFTLFAAMDDKQLNEKINMSFSNHEKFVKPKPNEDHTFSILHYAGKVDYTNDGWIKKNKHPLHADIVESMKLSKEQIIADMFRASSYSSDSSQKSNSAYGASRMRTGTLQTSLQAYTDQLGEVMSILKMTTPYFVRCIIPNYQKMPGATDYYLLKKQLQCNGVLEGIRIVRKGYINKVPYGTIKSQYHCLMPLEKQTQFADSKKFSLDLMEYLGIDKMLWKAGVTKLFLKSDLLGLMEDLKSKMLKQYIEVMQAVIMKSYYGVMQNKSLFSKTAIETIRNNVKIWYYTHRDNPWFKLVAKIKPTVQSLSQEQESRKLRDLNNSLKQKLDEASSQLQMQTELFNKSKDQNESIQAELEDTRQKYDNLTEEMNGAQSNLDQLAELVAHYEEDINAAEESKANLLNKIQEYEATLNLTTDQLNDAEVNRQSLINERQKNLNQVKELQERIAELEEALSRAKGHISSLESTNAELKKELDLLSSKFKSHQKKSDEVNDVLEEHDKELHVAKEQLTKVSSQNSALKRELDTANETLTDMQDKFDRLNGLNDRNNKNLLSMEESAQLLQKQKADIENELELSKANNEMLQEDYDNMKHRYEAEKKKVQALENQKSELSDSMMSSAEEAKLFDKQMRSNLESEKAKNASLEEEIEELRKKSQNDLQQTKHEASELQAKMKEQIGSSNSTIKKLQGEIEDLEDQLAQKKSHNAEVSNLNTKLEAKVNELNNRLGEETANNEALNEQLTKLQSTNKTMKNELMELQGQFDATKLKLSEATSELASASEQINALNDERRKTKSKISSLESDLESACHEHADVEEQKAQLEASHQQTVQKLSSTENQLKSVTEELEESEAIIKKLTNERDQLMNDNTLNKASLAKVHKDLKRSSGLVDNFQAEISQLKLEQEAAKKSYKGSETQIKTLKAANDTLEQNLSESQAAMVRKESKMKQLQGQLAEAEEKLTQLQSKNKELDMLLLEASSASGTEEKLTKTLRELNEKTNELNSMNAEFEEIDAENEKLKGEVHQLRQKIQSNQQQFQNELQSRSDESAEATQSLRQQLNETESRNVELMQKLKHASKDSKSHSQSLNDLEAANAELQTKFDNLTSQDKKLSNSLKDLESECAGLREQLSQEESKRNDLTSKLSNSKKLVSELEMEVGKNKSEISEMRNELSEMSSNLDSAQSNESKYKRASADALNQLNSLKQEMDDLEEQLNHSKNEANKFKLEASSSRNELTNLRDSLESENQMLNSKINGLRQSLNDAETDNNRHKQQLNSTKNRCRDIEMELEESQTRSKTDISKLSSKLKSAQKELEEMRNSTAAFEEKLEKLTSDNDKLRKDYRKMRMAYDESEKMNQQLRDNMNKIMNDLDD